MYGKVGAAASSGGVGAGTLAYTGFNTLAVVVAAVTLLFAGIALLKLVPRKARGVE